jgi:hypothetical protein
MAQITQTCGKTTVNFEDSCGYACNCGPTAGCAWIVGCPDGKGDLTYTSGTGIVAHPHRFPQVSVAGSLEAVAGILSKISRRPVLVPERLRNKKIRKRTIKGTPADVALALGLELGPPRRARGSAGKG